MADCYHPALAFSLNWAQTLMLGAGAAGVAFIGAEYLVGLLLPPKRRGANSVFLVALVLMLVLLLLNALGDAPALYILALAAVAAHVAFAEPCLALAGTAILLTGGPLFLIGRKLSRASAA